MAEHFRVPLGAGAAIIAFPGKFIAQRCGDTQEGGEGMVPITWEDGWVLGSGSLVWVPGSGSQGMQLGHKLRENGSNL